MPSRRSTRRPIRRKRKTTRTARVSPAVRKYVRRALPKVEVKQTWYHMNELQLNTLAQGYSNVGPVISQGTDSASRLGNIISATGLHYKGVLSNNSTQESMIRFAIVRYDSSLGAPNNIFFRGSSAGTPLAISAVNGLDAMYYPINRVDLHVYHDKLIKLAGSATGNAGANVKVFSKFVKLNRLKLEYKGSNPQWNYACVFIAADSNDDTSTGTSVELSCLERFFFKDA